MPAKEYLRYKGKPLVRKGKDIYYGNMEDRYVILFHIESVKKVGEDEIADKITVSLIDNDAAENAPDRVVKKSEKNGLYAAMDIGYIWLERALKQ